MSDAADEIPEELAFLVAQNRARRRRLARMLRWGSLIIALTFLWMLRGNIRYSIQSTKPVDLGGPIEFSLGGEKSEVYAKIQGVPASNARLAHKVGRSMRIFGILGSNVLVIQNLKNAPKPPNGNVPYHAQGRLVSSGDSPELSNVFQIMERDGSVVRENGAMYALWDGVAPRRGWVLPVELAGLIFFVIFNVYAARRLEKAAGA